MADLPIVAPVQRTLSSKSGLIAVVVVALVLFAIEAKTGAISKTLAGLPVVGPFFRKA